MRRLRISSMLLAAIALPLAGQQPSSYQPIPYSVLEVAANQNISDSVKHDISHARHLLKERDKLMKRMHEIDTELTALNNKVAFYQKSAAAPPTVTHDGEKK